MNGKRSVIGSFPYIAPEILEYGKPSVTPLSDIWAVGCIGYEMCTGKRLSHTQGRRVIDAQRLKDYGQKIDISDIPHTFGQYVSVVITKCLTFRPSSRPSAGKLRDYILQTLRKLNTNSLETVRFLPLPSLFKFPQESNDTISSSDSDLELGYFSDADEFVEVSAEGGAEIKLSKIPPLRNAEIHLRERLRNPELSIDPDDIELDQYGWVTGDDSAITHRNVIDRGASAEVHMVRSLIH